MAEPFDPTSVPPSKLEESRRRAAVVAEFAKLERPTKALAEAYAARLGIRVRFFYVLVQIYRERGTIVKPRKTPRPPANPAITPTVEAEIEAVIAEFGHNAPIAAVDAEVRTRCAAKGLFAPSWTAVRTRLRHARRRGRNGSEAFPDLVLDRTPLEFNIATDAGPRAAWLTVLLHAPSANVLAFHVSVGAAGANEAMITLLGAIGPEGEFALPYNKAIPAIAMYRDLAGDWDYLAEALGTAGLCIVGPIAPNVRVGAAITRLLGDRIGQIDLRPRLAPGKPAAKGGEGSEYDIALSVVTKALEGRLASSRCLSNDPRWPRLAANLKRLVRLAPPDVEPDQTD